MRNSSLAAIGAIDLGTAATVALSLILAPEPEGRDLPPLIAFAQIGSVAVGSGASPVYGSGTVRPRAEINVAPQVGRRVVRVNPGFRSGGWVEVGQTLFRIGETDYVYRPVDRPDPASGTPPLLLGEFVDVVIEGVSPDHYFRAPRAALRPGNHVRAATDGSVVSIVSVHELQRADDEVFFTDAPRGGQAVITRGLQCATEVMRIQTETDPAR
ncbi:MAG: hypothetical protein OXL34_17780 [Gemmatimonadota bacterium]|nr:hypothetical protein [Gemmatimonadota bacterium]